MLGRPDRSIAPVSWASSTSRPTASATAATILDPRMAIAAGLAMAASGRRHHRRRRREHPTAVRRRHRPRMEQARILPVIRGPRRGRRHASRSTRAMPRPWRAALDAGARIVNDVSGAGHDPLAAPLVAARRLPGRADAHARRPGDMYAEAQLRRCGRRRCGRTCRARSRPPSGRHRARAQIAIDPGHRLRQDAPEQSMEACCAVCRNWPTLGFPVLVGVSRKSFIGRLYRRARSAPRVRRLARCRLFARRAGRLDPARARRGGNGAGAQGLAGSAS